MTGHSLSVPILNGKGIFVERIGKQFGSCSSPCLFANYLNHSKHAKEDYEKLFMNRRNLQVGDRVLINIQKGNDRTNTDRRNLEAEIIQVSEDNKCIKARGSSKISWKCFAVKNENFESLTEG
jgi:hypothetical protein